MRKTMQCSLIRITSIVRGGLTEGFEMQNSVIWVMASGHAAIMDTNKTWLVLEVDLYASQ